MPLSSCSESHLDFDSDEEDEEADSIGKIEPFMSSSEHDSFSDISDGDSDAISFVLRESARALIEDVGFHDPAEHYSAPSISHLHSNVLDLLDDQLKNDPHASWRAICYREAAPEDAVPQQSSEEEQESTLRPQMKQLLISTITQNHPPPQARSYSPMTPGDPILAGTPPLSLTPKSPLPRSPPRRSSSAGPIRTRGRSARAPLSTDE